MLIILFIQVVKRAAEMSIYLYSNHYTGISIVRQEWILSAPRFRILDVSPSAHEIPVGHDAGEFPGDGAVNGFSDVEVCGEEDVEVALMNLYCAIV
jgi:hypothetical protein